MISVGHGQVASTLSELDVTVLDENGAVIPNSEITIAGHSETTVLHTDAAGKVTARLQTGRYVVAARRTGFTKGEIADLRIAAPKPEALRIVLKMDETTIVDGLNGVSGPQTSAADLTGTLVGSEPARVPPERPPIKARSWKCLYLWKCTKNSPNQ
jgi:hypothetical protein